MTGPWPKETSAREQGATVGKIFGMKQAMKSGIGTCSVTLGSGVIVAALIAVNALGDVIDPSSGHIIAGARKSPASGEFANSATVIRDGARRPAGGNTVLAVVATNARLDRVQTNKLAALGECGDRAKYIARQYDERRGHYVCDFPRKGTGIGRRSRCRGGRRNGDGGHSRCAGREDRRRCSGAGWLIPAG